MRALTMDEVGFVSGGWLHHTPGESWGDPPGWGGSEGFDQHGGGGGKKKSIWDSLGDFIGGVGDFLSGGVSFSWTSSSSDGTKNGVCLDKNGQVIRNKDGNPLLACESGTGAVTFSWGK